MQLENLREFAKRHKAPANPDQPQEGGQGSGIAQTFAAQVCARHPCLPVSFTLSIMCGAVSHVLDRDANDHADAHIACKFKCASAWRRLTPQ